MENVTSNKARWATGPRRKIAKSKDDNSLKIVMKINMPNNCLKLKMAKY